MKKIVSILFVLLLLVNTLFSHHQRGKENESEDKAAIQTVSTPASKTFFFDGTRNTMTTSISAHNAGEAVQQLDKLSDEFGYRNAFSNLTEKSTTEIDGDYYYRLQQNYQGIPVYGRTIVCASDASGHVISLTGNIADVPKDIALTPTVSDYQIIESVRRYLAQNIGIRNAECLEISKPSQENICIYNMGDTEKASLAYCINVGIYEIVVDAENGAVLAACPIVYSANENNEPSSVIGYSASDYLRENGFNITKYASDSYVMKDSSRNISVYVLDGNRFIENNLLWPKRAILVESSDEIFGNTDTEVALSYETGALLLKNIVKVHDYFKQLGFTASGQGTNLYYNDGSDQGKNAWGGYGDLYNNRKDYGFLAMGTVTGVNDLDVLCHEYTHRVSGQLVGFIGGSVQTGAINEGLSDIFGELLEAQIFCKTDTPDWVVLGDNIPVRRNIANPKETGNIDTAPNIFDTNKSKYAYSTVISHAAYLMWNGIDGNDNKKIDTGLLAKLWYRAMLLMPADCDFTTCRRMVELAALSVNGLTDVQRECIAEAFDMVRIYTAELSPEIIVDCDYNIRPISVLNVYSVDGNLHPNYSLNISGTIAEQELSYSSDIRTDIGYRYEKAIEIKEASAYRLELPCGYYTFTISDSNNPQYTYIFTVSVSDQGNDDSIELYTDFENRLLVKITEETTKAEADKRLTQANVRFENGNNWQVKLNYNENGLLTGYTQDSYSPDNEVHYSYAYTYNSDGKLTQSQEILSGFPCSRYYYDDEGKMTGWEFWEFSWSSSKAYTCEYNASGQRIRDISTSGKDETLYFYDDLGRLVSISSRWVYGDMSGTDETTMTYDEYGNLSKKEILSDSGLGFPSMQTFLYNYDHFPFVHVTVYSDGEVMYSCLDYTAMPADEGISFTIDKSAKFESEDGYLVKVIGEDCEWNFSYICGTEQHHPDDTLGGSSDNENSIQDVSELNNKWASAYIPVIENTICKAYEIAGMDMSDGVLSDVDGDGIPELLLSYPLLPDNETWRWHFAFSVYDYKEGNLVTIVEDASIGATACAGGVYGYTNVVYYRGTPMIIAYRESGETSLGEGIYLAGTREAILYSFDGTTPFRKICIRTTNYEISFSINDASVTEDEFLSELNDYTFLSLEQKGPSISLVCSYEKTKLTELIDYLNKQYYTNPQKNNEQDDGLNKLPD